MKKKLFNGAVLYHPTEGNTQLLLLELGFLATSEETAKIELLRNSKLSSSIKDYPSDQLEVIVRPF